MKYEVIERLKVPPRARRGGEQTEWMVALFELPMDKAMKLIGNQLELQKTARLFTNTVCYHRRRDVAYWVKIKVFTRVTRVENGTFNLFVWKELKEN